MNQLQMVKEFSDATGRFPKYEEGSDFDLMKWGLIEEEFKEADDAWGFYEPDADILKELCDLLYVINGYALYRGWDIDTAFNRVHKSNMSKVSADGIILRRADGKILKPDHYQPPNLEDLV